MVVVKIIMLLFVLISFPVTLFLSIARDIRDIESETYCRCLYRDNESRVKCAKERIKSSKISIIIHAVALASVVALYGYAAAVVMNDFKVG